jgi:hypothetical protein
LEEVAMVWMRRAAIWLTVAAGLASTGLAGAQEMPSEYQTVLTALGKGGDFKDGVLKVNIPRTMCRSRSSRGRHRLHSGLVAG